MGVTRFPNGVEIGDSTTAGTFSIGGTAVTATAAELNYVHSAASTGLLAYTATGAKIAAGTVVVPSGAAGTAFATGLATVSYVVATTYGELTGAGTSYVDVRSTKTGSAGSVTLYGLCQAGTASLANGTATWFAIGT